jgi:hypothetical protein
MSSTHDTSNYLEALKLVKDFSNGLVVVQSAALGVIGSLLKQPPSGWHLILTFLLLLSIIYSIWVGAVWISGTIPYIVQNLPSKLDFKLSMDEVFDIYKEKGGVGGLDLGAQCQLQSKLFILSLGLFALFVVFLPPQANIQ